MAEAAKRRATYQDVLDAPPHKVAEVIFGRLHVFPRPRARHARASSTLGADLGSAFDRGRGGPGGWIILDEPELHLGSEPDIIVPDIAGWRRERMPEVPDVVYFTLAPDWVCEVLSPRTEKLDRSDKMTIYAREGVRHVWLLAPDKRLLEVYRLDAGDWRRVAVYRDEDTPRAEPFEAIELELAALWIAPAPESP